MRPAMQCMEKSQGWSPILDARVLCHNMIIMTHARHSHPAAMDPDALLKSCTTHRSKGSGPGGQHRNKVQTAVTLTHTPTGVSASASERRSQAENARVALGRLRVNLALETRGDYPLAQGPSTLLSQRVRQGRLSLNPDHADFPAILAEVLDLLSLKQGDVASAGLLLDLTPTQVIKLLRYEPRALALVNQWREARGQHGLK